MKISERIIFLDDGLTCIFFPTGSPESGGSCYFMTPKCWEHCPGNQTRHGHEVKAMKYFFNHSVITISERIIRELKYFKSDFLGWFSWGDCPPVLVEKVFSITQRLKGMGIFQVGFTRNEILWKKIKPEKTLRFGLTVDDYSKALERSNEGVISHPNVVKNEALIMCKGKEVAW